MKRTAPRCGCLSVTTPFSRHCASCTGITRFVGFNFEVAAERTRTWLRFGREQRLRFFLEMLTSLVPHLFVCSARESEQRFLRKVYAAL